ncbi:hypothetical protein [Wielerella bovis]|uniref:hypothetical protein n=1 Tax=Wielerella bovis TaxID=2917790 RepID=UPI00201A025D|nr:hypothetical protein [Wielerella bovis]MCG7655916.1 hypothetical protein [Wielerella bovis]MCG7656886.1 hypothetical protein [Wielerella bovis]MCG7658105.1 hypothetical protein [Wielerella bovis]MCG7658167.1 hypothetical protein [Wielerella bovis]MCG7659109.1 hypothetical protein [Wielerella bovis]
MPYLYVTSSDVEELVGDLNNAEKEALLQKLLEETEYVSFHEKIKQLTNQITAVELECQNITLPRNLRELLYELTGREIGQ